MYIQYGKQKCCASGRPSQLKVKKKVQSETPGRSCSDIRSRSEQAQGSEFHPRDASEKNNCGFLGPSWCSKKVHPETFVPCGLYELLLSNVAHQMNEKLTIQNKFSHF